MAHVTRIATGEIEKAATGTSAAAELGRKRGKTRAAKPSRGNE
jgi:hypothetical protein